MIKFKLKQLRLQHNDMQQKELIQLSGIRSSTVSDFENNHALAIKIEQINKLCKIFQCQPNDLMEYIPDDNEVISKQLLDLRKSNSFTETEVAYKFGIDYPTYIKYESGEEPIPFDIIVKACNLYQVPQNYFGVNSDLVSVGNKGKDYSIQNSNDSETLIVSDEEFQAVKEFLEEYRNQ